MVISIIAANNIHAQIMTCLQQEKELLQMVEVLNETAGLQASAFFIHVTEQAITLPIDWYNQLPPILYPETIAYTDKILLGIIYSRLGNAEKALQYFDGNEAMQQVATLFYALQNNLVIPSETIKLLATHKAGYALHNRAIMMHYDGDESTIEAINQAYGDAIKEAPNKEYKAFTIKHFALFSIDTLQYQQAEAILTSVPFSECSTDAVIEMKAVLCALWMKQLFVPYNETLLAKLKDTLWEVLVYYEQNNRKTAAALQLTDASYIANISNQFSESLGYINKAIQYFSDEQQDELVANAQIRKGTLLFTWAQSGQPQFYKGAIDAYQQALRVFTRENAADVFADIHHHLGIIYSEIPDEVKKKSIWASVSLTSFNEALNFYNKVDYPYQFAVICNNLGNAYTKYPAALHSDNYDKALAYYNESLSIRNAQNYPEERALTLLNYLEAAWYVRSEEDESARLQQLKSITRELLTLTKNEQILNETQGHIAKLQELETALKSNTVNA